MTTKQARDYLNSHDVSDYNLVDVRQEWEYEEFHLPGAKLIPLPELADRLYELAAERFWEGLWVERSSSATLMTNRTSSTTTK